MTISHYPELQAAKLHFVSLIFDHLIEIEDAKRKGMFVSYIGQLQETRYLESLASSWLNSSMLFLLHGKNKHQLQKQSQCLLLLWQGLFQIWYKEGIPILPKQLKSQVLLRVREIF